MKLVKLSTILSAVAGLAGIPSNKITAQGRFDIVLQISEALRDAWQAVPWWQSSVLEQRYAAPAYVAGMIYAQGDLVRTVNADGAPTYYAAAMTAPQLGGEVVSVTNLPGTLLVTYLADRLATGLPVAGDWMIDAAGHLALLPDDAALEDGTVNFQLSAPGGFLPGGGQRIGRLVGPAEAVNDFGGNASDRASFDATHWQTTYTPNPTPPSLVRFVAGDTIIDGSGRAATVTGVLDLGSGSVGVLTLKSDPFLPFDPLPFDDQPIYRRLTPADLSWTTATDLPVELPLVQRGEVEMGDITEVWSADPRTAACARPVTYELRDERLELCTAGRAFIGIWVEYQRCVPILEGTLWETGKAVLAGTVRYDLAAGDCYRARIDLTTGANVTAPHLAAQAWELMGFPEHLASIVKYGASADLLRADGQEDKAAARERMRAAAFDAACMRQTEHQQQHVRGRRR